MSAFSIRPAAPADVIDLARIWHAGWKDGHDGHIPPGLAEHRTEGQFESRIRDRLDCTWVAESDGRVLGFVVVVDDELEQIYVDESARGTSVAETLLRKGETEIRGAGYREAWLAVVAGNQRARSFYSRCGWRDAGPFSYRAETEAGPFEVPSHRYVIDLVDPAPDDGGEP